MVGRSLQELEVVYGRIRDAKGFGRKSSQWRFIRFAMHAHVVLVLNVLIQVIIELLERVGRALRQVIDRGADPRDELALDGSKKAFNLALTLRSSRQRVRDGNAVCGAEQLEVVHPLAS